MEYRKLWLWFIVITVGSFSVLGYYEVEIYRQAPSRNAQMAAGDR